MPTKQELSTGAPLEDILLGEGVDQAAQFIAGQLATARREQAIGEVMPASLTPRARGEGADFRRRTRFEAAGHARDLAMGASAALDTLRPRPDGEPWYDAINDGQR